MHNLDLQNQTRNNIILAMNKAIAEGNTDEFNVQFMQLCTEIKNEVVSEAKLVQKEVDRGILNKRGVRSLTSNEKEYYNQVIECFRSADPKQAISSITEVLPKTVIEAVFEELEASHELLAVIDFVNTEALIEYIVNTNPTESCSWGSLVGSITKELSTGFKKVPMNLKKLSAFLVVAKSMADLGPEWLDKYVRRVLMEALANGLEFGIIKGDGKDAPIGMTRQVGDDVTITGGVYPEKTPIVVKSFDPLSYGNLLSKLAVDHNGKSRVFKDIILIVSMKDYLTKVMPATTIRSADGTYVNNVFPFPTRIIQSIHMDEGRAVIGIANRYFMGLGTSLGGKLEVYDQTRAIEDENLYIIKLYGFGMPKDNNAFQLLDISTLVAPVLEVKVVDQTAPAQVNTLNVDPQIQELASRVLELEAAKASESENENVDASKDTLTPAPTPTSSKK